MVDNARYSFPTDPNPRAILHESFLQPFDGVVHFFKNAHGGRQILGKCLKHSGGSVLNIVVHQHGRSSVF